MLLNRTSVVMLLNRTGGVVWALKPPKSHPWALVHQTTYAPMIYTALCVMLLMQPSKWDGVGPWKSRIKSIADGAV
jgi:hypothetical protein